MNTYVNEQDASSLTILQQVQPSINEVNYENRDDWITPPWEGQGGGLFLSSFIARHRAAVGGAHADVTATGIQKI